MILDPQNLSFLSELQTTETSQNFLKMTVQISKHLVLILLTFVNNIHLQTQEQSYQNMILTRVK